jgi:hypothetical protein
VLTFVGSAALIAAFVATKGGKRNGPAPRSEAIGRSEAEDGGGWLFCLAM